MKCPVCRIEMRLEERKDGAEVWVCRNAKCPKHGEKQVKEAAQDGAD